MIRFDFFLAINGQNNLIISNTTISRCNSSLGGCIYIGSSNDNITITKSIISNCIAYGRDASGNGGGIYIFDNNFNTAIIESEFIENYAETSGGGLFSVSNDLLVFAGTSFINNTAQLYGGGIYLLNLNDNLLFTDITAYQSYITETWIGLSYRLEYYSILINSTGVDEYKIVFDQLTKIGYNDIFYICYTTDNIECNGTYFKVPRFATNQYWPGINLPSLIIPATSNFFLISSQGSVPSPLYIKFYIIAVLLSTNIPKIEGNSIYLINILVNNNIFTLFL